MASSGTTTFNLSVDEVIEEAYERCGVRTNSGYDIKSARRSLNLLFSEWGNRGINLWKVKSKTETLVNGSITYNTPSDCNDVLEAVVTVSGGNQQTLTKISRSEYIAIPNKSETGTPSQYYVDRQITPTISLYLAPDTSAVTNIFYYYLARIEDVGAYTNTTDMPFRFFPCMVSGLAFYLSQKIAPDRLQALKLLYEDELKRALEEDGQRTSVYISPNIYYPQG
jgi:hypothetical protein|tara:strand:- start:97 stop:768 length:672 start_codon:yes stop_codon:yes gene_type:complete